MALIVCPDCNNPISEFAKQCPFCGRPVVTQESRLKPVSNYASQATTPAPEPSSSLTSTTTPQSGTAPEGLPPKSWVIESILVTCFCCMPLGIASIMYSTKVETLWYSGDKEGALRTSKEAEKWTKIAFFSGMAVILLYLVFVVFMIWFGGNRY